VVSLDYEEEQAIGTRHVLLTSLIATGDVKGITSVCRKLWRVNCRPSSLARWSGEVNNECVIIFYDDKIFVYGNYNVKK
jgi:hypothetical protein